MSIGLLLDSDGNTVVTGADLGNILAGAIAAKKIFIQNDDLTRVTGAVTGVFSQYDTQNLHNLAVWALCPDTLSCPFNVTAAAVAGGSLTADTEYNYRITAYNATGETVGSIEVSVTTTSVNKSVQLEWDEIVGATGYKVYRSTSSVYSDNRLVDYNLTPPTGWVDPGTAAPTGYTSLPDENTTAGASPLYGSIPSGSLASGDLAVGVLQKGQQVAIWIGAETLVSTPDEATNARFRFTEA